jgi:hypothetical protein
MLLYQTRASLDAADRPSDTFPLAREDGLGPVLNPDIASSRRAAWTPALLGGGDRIAVPSSTRRCCPSEPGHDVDSVSCRGRARTCVVLKSAHRNTLKDRPAAASCRPQPAYRSPSQRCKVGRDQSTVRRSRPRKIIDVRLAMWYWRRDLSRKPTSYVALLPQHANGEAGAHCRVRP